MDISEVILHIEELDEDLVIFAKRVDGQFVSSSEAVLLELTEEERVLKTSEIATKYCPGFDYFLEAFIVKEMAVDMKASNEYKTSEQILMRIISYAEFDA